MSNSITVTFPPDISDDLRKICGAIECNISWYVERVLQDRIENVLEARQLGCLEAASLVYDDIAEAKRVTAACDSIDQRTHEWRFFENKDGKIETDYAPDFIADLAKSRKEVA